MNINDKDAQIEFLRKALWRIFAEAGRAVDEYDASGEGDLPHPYNVLDNVSNWAEDAVLTSRGIGIWKE